MKIALALTCAVALAGCTDAESNGRPEPVDNSGRTMHEIGRMPAEVVAKPAGLGVSGAGPFCVLMETTGGAYGAPRYTVHLSTSGDGAGRFVVPEGTTPPVVFFELQVEAGGRRYDGYVTTAAAVQHQESKQMYVPPIPATTSFGSLPMAPRDRLGVQQVPKDVTACRLSLVEPDEPARLLGGTYVQGGPDNTPVVLDPEGAERPADYA